MIIKGKMGDAELLIPESDFLGHQFWGTSAKGTVEKMGSAIDAAEGASSRGHNGYLIFLWQKIESRIG